MLKKLAALLMAAAMLLSMTAAGAETAQAPVTISFYSTQAGVDDATVALLDEFMAQHPGITVEYYPCGDDQLAAWLALYSAGTAPTVSLLDVGQILNYSDYMYDFNQGDTEWMSHVLSGWEYCQKEGSEAIYGIPSSYQGFGLMYNKDLVAEVLGEDFDVNTVNTVDKLVEFFDAFEAAGTPATVVFSADWALGSHYLACQLFSEWLGDKETQRAILNGMYTGETKLMELEHRFRAMVPVDEAHPSLNHTTMAVTRLEGGIMTNVIPANAVMELDIRTLPSLSHDALLEKAQGLCREMMEACPGLHLEMEVLNNRPAVEVAEEHQFVSLVKDCCKEAGIEPVCKGLYFYTDASQVVPALGCPFVIFGPGEDTMAHQIDERIDIHSMARVGDAYYAAMEKICL